MPGGSLAVVTGHGANLGLGLARVLGIPDGARILGPFGNCRWSVAEPGAGPVAAAGAQRGRPAGAGG